MKLTTILNSEYEKVEEKVDKKIFKNKSKKMYELIKLAQDWFFEAHSAPNYRLMHYYVIKKIKEISFTSDDITELCFYAQDFKKYDSYQHKPTRVTFDYDSNEEYIGLFLSALIFIDQEHSKKAKEYHLVTSEFEMNLHFIGMKNKRSTISVQGDVGDYLGKEMEGGKIIVQGNAERYVGDQMTNGEIYIQGNAGSLMGDCMTDGNIIIEKNAGDAIGNGMSGGKIWINGDMGEIASTMTLPYTKKGEIYHKGEKVKLPFP